MTPKLENLGSLITYKDAQGNDVCLGYLMDFTGHGIYDPSLGRVDVSKEHADTHNRILDEAMLKGLDENCQLKQGGSFYAIPKDGKMRITTFMGTVVSEDTSRNRQSLTFYRNGKAYRGRMSREHDLFNFRRVA